MRIIRVDEEYVDMLLDLKVAHSKALRDGATESRGVSRYVVGDILNPFYKLTKDLDAAGIKDISMLQIADLIRNNPEMINSLRATKVA